jgi:hypothetical protein
LNRISGEYEAMGEIVDLVKRGALLQTEYDLRYGCMLGKINDSTITINVPGEMNSTFTPYTIALLGPWYCAIHTLYDNCTLDLLLSVHSISSGAYVTPTVQNGNVFDPGKAETLPVIWSVNATVTGMYSISLGSRGWYTISLGGSIANPNTIGQDTFRCMEGDCSASLIIMYKGTVSPFIVTTSALP